MPSVDGKISGLAQGSPALSSDFIPIERAGLNFYLTPADIAALAAGFANPMILHGDMIYEDASLGPAALPIGSNGQLLTVVGGQPAWAAAPSGGLVTVGPRAGNYYSARITTSISTYQLVGTTSPPTQSTNGTNTVVAATATTPPYMSLHTGAGNAETGQAAWDFAGGSTPSLLPVGIFRCFSTYSALLQTTNTRAYWGVTDNGVTGTTTLRGTDTPVANVIGFAYSTDAGDTNYMCVVNKDASHQTRTSSGVAADTNFHLFAITYDGTNAKFYIDGTLVATIANSTTGFPAAATAVDGFVYVNSPSASEVEVGVEWMYMEGL